jgi:Bacterial PH domain
VSHDDFEVEPIPGLPERPPAGESILWQGAPDWRALALRDFHLRELAAYFALMLLWRGGATLASGESIGAALVSVLTVAPLALAALGLVALFAWRVARTTVYTITNRRVAMRFGIALPMTVNVPFTAIEAAALKLNAGGSGEISLALAPGQQLAYLMMWPHTRPWKVAKPQPALRAIGDAAATGDLLARAMAAAVNGVTRAAPSPVQRPERESAPLAAGVN